MRNINVELDSLPYMEKLEFETEEELNTAYNEILPYIYSKNYRIILGKNYILKLTRWGCKNEGYIYIYDKKKDKGFTLVELIVVIVILAILIGVTIGGIYMYVGKARQNVDENTRHTYEKMLSMQLNTDEEFMRLTSGLQINILLQLYDSLTPEMIEDSSNYIGDMFGLENVADLAITTNIQNSKIVCQEVIDSGHVPSKLTSDFANIVIQTFKKMYPNGTIAPKQKNKYFRIMITRTDDNGTKPVIVKCTLENR